ncbi:unnamed protein product [Auanema sp. JU1783]|nr:unnamed protein product [Auanema sp. JU1783]
MSDKRESDEQHEDNNLQDMQTELGFSNMTLAHSGMEEVVDQLLPVAPDGGYGWVIVFAAFMSNLIVDGICNAFGELKGAFKERFKANDAVTALIGSLLIGVYLLVGPLVGGLVNKYGARKTVILGSFIGGAGLLLSAAAPNITVFLLLYGVVGGIGFGMIYLPAIVIVGFYFESKRAVATGIAVAGSGVGTILIPVLSEYCLKEFGLVKTLFVLACLLFSCVFYGVLYKPLTTPAQPEKDVELNLLKNEEKDYEGRKDGSNPHSPTGDNHEGRNSIRLGALSSSALNTSKSNLDGNSMSRVSAKNLAQSMNLLNQVQGSNMSLALSGVDATEFSRPLNRSDIFYSGSIKNLKEFKQEGSNLQQYRASVLSIPKASLAANLGSGDLHEGAKLAESHLSGLCHIERDNDKCKCLPLTVRNAFNEMIDLEMLKDPVMICLCLSNLLGMMGFYIPILFMKDLALASDVPADLTKYLIPCFGVTNTVGRVVFGWVADRGYMTALNINNLSLLSCGVLTIISTFLNGFEQLLVYCAVFGFIISAYISLTSIVLTDLLGLEKLTNSFGILVVARGVASLAGAPFAGVVYEMTNSYPAAFVFAGVLIILSGLISCLVPCVTKTKQSKEIVKGRKQKHDDSLSGKLSVVSECSEEEHQRTIQSLRQQNMINQE